MINNLTMSLQLSAGLPGDDLARRARIHHAVDYVEKLQLPQDFSRGQIRKIILPVFTRVTYESHRQDISVKDYIDHMVNVIEEIIEPRVRSGVMLRDSTTMFAKRPGGVDEEANFMEVLAKKIKEHIDIIQPL